MNILINLISIMKNYKINLTILIIILLLFWLSIFLYYYNIKNIDITDNNRDNSNISEINNNQLFIEKVNIDFNSLSQEDE